TAPRPPARPSSGAASPASRPAAEPRDDGRAAPRLARPFQCQTPHSTGVSAMSAQQDVLGLIDAGGQIGRAPLVGMQFLHERTVRATNVGLSGPRLKAEHLTSLLFRHRARSRLVAAPRVSVAVSVFTPGGKPAVEI